MKIKGKMKKYIRIHLYENPLYLPTRTMDMHILFMYDVESLIYDK